MDRGAWWATVHFHPVSKPNKTLSNSGYKTAKETLMYIEQSCGLCGRGRRWDDLGEWHWNMYNIIYETNLQSRFYARYWMFGAGALGWLRGMVRGGRREEGSGWGTRVYLWRIYVDIWQNQYNIVKLKNKINKSKEKKKRISTKGVKESESCSVLFDSLQAHELYSPWNSPRQNTGYPSFQADSLSVEP